MQTLTDTITSWEEQSNPADRFLSQQDVIATEVQQQESPEWRLCIDALLKTWTDISEGRRADGVMPNHSAIESALAWIMYLKKRFPFSPPTYIVPEPAGGLIVERRTALSDGRDYVCDLTFYNNGPAEVTIYVDGRVEELDQIPLRPE